MNIRAFRSTSKHRPQIILANGSERGDYIDLQHIHEKLGFLQDGIQLMKTYYPHDPRWSPRQKISEITQKKNVGYAWDYEYEDYHPFDLFATPSQTRHQLNEIQSYGADIHLTLTLDIGLCDEELRNIVRELSAYGRVYIRINHEVNGNWFRYNKLHHPEEVSRFFVRFHKIMKAESSQLFSVFNVSADVFMEHRAIRSDLLRLKMDQCGEALQIADFWSIDKYVSLHYAWPFQQSISETNSGYFSGTAEEWWRMIAETYLQLIWHNHGTAKKVFISEFNSDSDVDGLAGQAEMIERIYSRLAMADYPWLAGIVLYQFRDFGGLGLQKGNQKSYTDNPALKIYREALPQFTNQIQIDSEEWKYEEFTFAWNPAEEKRGLIIENLPPETLFTNQFNRPLFFKKATQFSGSEKELLSDNAWLRLEINASAALKNATTMALVLPPEHSDKGTSPYHTVTSIRETLRKMFTITEKN